MFAVRLRVPVGTVQAHKPGKLGELAGRYGDGSVHATSRQGIEIPGIRFADIESARLELASVGLAPGTCGPKVATFPPVLAIALDAIRSSIAAVSARSWMSSSWARSSARRSKLPSPTA